MNLTAGHLNPRLGGLFHYICLAVALIFLIHTGITHAQATERLNPDRSVSFQGELYAEQNLSAMSSIGSFLVIASDEAIGKKRNKNYIQFLKADGSGNYQLSHDILLLEGDKKDGREMDIEAMAADGNQLYVIGSHALVRKRIKEKLTYKKNLKRISKLKREESRNSLYRIELNDEAKEIKHERISLKELLEKDPMLSAFTHIPSKENGIDIEGLAVKDGKLYAGFRGPVLRHGYVPVLTFDFDHMHDSYQTLYVQLNGRGIRSMETVSDGFLIIAGPVGDGDDSFQLWHWNSFDTLAGTDRKAQMGKMTLLGELPATTGAKAEGLTLLSENSESYQMLVIYDGLAMGGVQHFRINKP